MKIRRTIVFILTLALMLCSVAEVFAASSYGKASTITLEKFTGTVKISNASGKSVTARTGMRLYSGYSISTETNSNAYISLDSTKALMLESASEIKLKKSGNKIDIMLENGTVVTDISESLENDESMDIHTTNTVTGIRGTGVEVSYFGPIGATRICMLDGTTSNYDKFDDGLHVVSAGHGIEVGGGAATVEPIGDSIAVSDLQPETQRLMILDGGISVDVLEGFNESFGIDELSDEDKQDLEDAVGAVVEQQNEENQQAEEDAATAVVEIHEEAEQKAAEEGFWPVDPVFEDQSSATGIGAVLDDVTVDDQTPIVNPNNSDPGTSGDTQTADAVNVTIPAGDSFASFFAIVGEEEFEGPTTMEVTPEETVFWINYDGGNEYLGYTVACSAAYIGSTQLSETSTPAYLEGQGVSGKFFAKSTLPESGGTLTATMTVTLEALSEPAMVTNAFSLIDSIASSDSITAATRNYDSSDQEALSEKMKYDKLTWVPYQGSGSSTDE
ncbi:MAG: FecR domain-containing protein, partial [Firmicutes bacterium]|nr:FecR domain-containing protein [Bacillota bacterium]